MQNPRLASRYAKSLLDLAKEQNSVAETLADMQLMDAVCSQSKDFVAMLRSPIIKADKKNQIVMAVLGGKLHKLTEAFIKLLISKSREQNLPEIAHAFLTQYKEYKNIKTVKLTTATTLSDSVRDVIISRVKASLPEHSIELKEEVNPALIGGFVLQVEDKLVDASIARDLNDVRTQFLKNIYVSELR